MRRWGADNEERAACTRKAQDAYALARQAMEKISGAEARAVEAFAEAAQLTAELATARGRIATLERRVTELERGLDEATMPRRVRAAAPTRKAA